jgi:NAD(P)-dependent dehydrogenase (short-subunit alcohol dehydrogenase family)
MRTELRHKVVCITGAAGGIGRAIAEAFAKEGARLALIDVNAEGLEELAAALRAEGTVTVNTAVADLRTEQGVQEGILAALAAYEDAINILVPNVGALIAGPFETLESRQLQEAFAINFFTHVYACRVAVPLMKRRGGGCIIFTGSDQALQPDAGLGPYAQAKAATHCFAKMLARELASDGIRVNVVAPGMTRTPLVEVLMEQRAREFGTDFKSAERMELAQRGVPLARLGEPWEVAEAVLYLATASFCTGTILNISGGNVRAIMC